MTPQVAITFTTPQEVTDALTAELAEWKTHFVAMSDLVTQHEATIAQLTAERDTFSAKITANIAEIERLVAERVSLTNNKNTLVRGYSKSLAAANAEIHVWACLLTVMALNIGHDAGIEQAKIGAYVVEQISLAMWHANQSGGFVENIDVEAAGNELARMEEAVDRVCDKLHLPRLEDARAWRAILDASERWKEL